MPIATGNPIGLLLTLTYTVEGGVTANPMYYYVQSEEETMIYLDVDTALSEVPVNTMPLIDDTDFKTREESVTYNQSGLDLVWNFVKTDGSMSQTAVTPTDTGGAYDWVNQGNGMYSIEIPASGGASINNDTEGFGWFTGFATGILPWRGPVIGFRAAGLNDKLIDSAYSATRGLAGTALPDAAADAAGGLPISDDGGLDLDAIKEDTAAILADTNELQTDDTPGALSTISGKIDTIDGIVDDILVDTGTTLDGIVDSILEDTNELQAELADGGRTDLLIDAILADTNELQVDDTPGAIAAVDAKIDTIDGIVDDILEDTGTTIPGTITTIDDEIAVIDGIVDDIVADTNELQTDWANDGRLDLILDAAGSAGDPWSTEIPGAYAAGTAGKILGDNINAPLDTIDANVDSILEDTGTTIPGTIATIDDEIAVIDGNVDSILEDTGTTLDGKIDTIDTNVDAVLADTGTDGVVLADDAITAAKIAANAIGASELAADAVAEIADGVWDEAAGDHLAVGSTGESLGSGATASNVWTYGNRTLTMTPEEVEAAVDGTSITQTRGSDWTISISGLSWTGSNMQFAIKYDYPNPDAGSILFVDEVGLWYLNGESVAVGNRTLATMSYTSGTLTITVDSSITAQLEPGTFVYGMQDIGATGLVSEPYIGEFVINADVIRATS